MEQEKRNYRTPDSQHKKTMGIVNQEVVNYREQVGENQDANATSYISENNQIDQRDRRRIFTRGFCLLPSQRVTNSLS